MTTAFIWTLTICRAEASALHARAELNTDSLVTTVKHRVLGLRAKSGFPFHTYPVPSSREFGE